jgi:hypothetical protein
MSYRPQFAYPPTPQGVKDDFFSYSFDYTNTPGLANAVPANNTVLDIPLPLQTDALFLCRAMRFSPVNLGVIVRDTFGRPLQDNYVPINLCYSPSGIAIAGFLPVAIEDEELCAPGGVFLLNFQNQTVAPIIPGKITMYGVKRYRP